MSRQEREDWIIVERVIGNREIDAATANQQQHLRHMRARMSEKQTQRHKKQANKQSTTTTSNETTTPSTAASEDHPMNGNVDEHDSEDDNVESEDEYEEDTPIEQYLVKVTNITESTDNIMNLYCILYIHFLLVVFLYCLVERFTI
jgi:hypothetical protein